MNTYVLNELNQSEHLKQHRQKSSAQKGPKKWYTQGGVPARTFCVHLVREILENLHLIITLHHVLRDAHHEL